MVPCSVRFEGMSVEWDSNLFGPLKNDLFQTPGQPVLWLTDAVSGLPCVER